MSGFILIRYSETYFVLLLSTFLFLQQQLRTENYHDLQQYQDEVKVFLFLWLIELIMKKDSNENNF